MLQPRLLFALSFIYFATNLAAQTLLSGRLSGIYEADGNPYIFVEDCFVEEEDTVQFEAGCELLYRAINFVTIYNLGTLIFNGTEDQTISINMEEGLDACWLNFDCDLTGSINFHFTGFSIGYFDFRDIRSINNLSFDNCRFELDRINGGRFRVQRCMLHECKGGQIVVVDGGWQLTDCDSLHASLGITGRGSGRISNSTNCSLIIVTFYGPHDILIENSNNCLLGMSLRDSTHAVVRNYRGYFDSVSLDRGCSLYVDDYWNEMDLQNSESYTYYRIGESSYLEALNSGPFRYVDLDHRGASARLENCMIITDYGLMTYFCKHDLEITLENCTIFQNHGSDLFRFSHGIYARTGVINMRNCIVVGDSINCGLVVPEPDDLFEIPLGEFEYNTFWGYDIPLPENINETNVIADPMLIYRPDRNFQLQSVSPCIDSGDPDGERDPDGSRSDRGCFFHDHRSDHPPYIQILHNYWSGRGLDISIQGYVSDDRPDIDFNVINCPDWLDLTVEENEVLHFTLENQIPQNASSFALSFVAEDNGGQTDSTSSEIYISERNVLLGEISGVLSAANSPYEAIYSLVVPEGDTLIVEPGVTVDFRFVDDKELKLFMQVDGVIQAVGTPVMPITFGSSANKPSIVDWYGITCESNSNIFNYFQPRNALYGISVGDDADVAITNSSFIDRAGVRFCGGSGIVLNCEFLRSDILLDSGTTVDILDNRFMESDLYITNTTDGGVISVTNNRFDEGWICNLNYISYLQNGIVRISRNLIKNSPRCGIWSISDSWTINNNTIAHSRHTGIRNVDAILHSNIVAFSDSVGIDQEARHNPSGGYNDVFGSGWVDYLDREAYETDISVDPDFIGIFPYDCSLNAESNCIDSGHPGYPNDPDGSRNDIGAFPYLHNNNPISIVGISPDENPILIRLIDEQSLVAILTDPDRNQPPGVSWQLGVVEPDTGGGERDTLWQEFARGDTAIFSISEFPLGATVMRVLATDGYSVSTIERDVIIMPSSIDNQDPTTAFPLDFILHPAYPNPFNAETSIRYSLPTHSDVSLAIFDLCGRRIKTLVNAPQKAGYHTAIWDGRNEAGIPVSSGLYFYRINAANFTKVRKMTMVK
ncbi:MAG TPA: FlgD immunoglobulin-like domain containing protein [Anaerolineae bacterium]|nr:FlgD immunoglobulin-like domain containing protein [Anaerolineae bacterium]